MKRNLKAPCLTAQTTGIAWSVLTEIAGCLKALAANGISSSIDLRSLPMSQADRDQLEELLGRGEVNARLEIAGPSEVWETAYSGVWWVRHKGAGGRVATEEIVVTRIPPILLAHPEDIEVAAARLNEDLQSRKTGDLEREILNDPA
jgi:hydrogenase-1 operon protein HyaF